MTELSMDDVNNLIFDGQNMALSALISNTRRQSKAYGITMRQYLDGLFDDIEWMFINELEPKTAADCSVILIKAKKQLIDTIKKIYPEEVMPAKNTAPVSNSKDDRKELIDMIYDLSESLYPGTIWIDTGSDMDACRVVVDTIKKDYGRKKR